MASKLDEFDMKAPVADLLYPSVEKHNSKEKKSCQPLRSSPEQFVDKPGA